MSSKKGGGREETPKRVGPTSWTPMVWEDIWRDALEHHAFSGSQKVQRSPALAPASFDARAPEGYQQSPQALTFGPYAEDDEEMREMSARGSAIWGSRDATPIAGTSGSLRLPLEERSREMGAYGGRDDDQETILDDPSDEEEREEMDRASLGTFEDGLMGASLYRSGEEMDRIMREQTLRHSLYAADNEADYLNRPLTPQELQESRGARRKEESDRRFEWANSEGRVPLVMGKR